VIHESKLLVVCGIVNGHWDGHVAWLDVCDLKTRVWSRLPDAPRARDRFQATVIAGKLYAVGGRRSSAPTKEVFTRLEPATDVFDLKTAAWSTLPTATDNLPTPRAGTMNLARGRHGSGIAGVGDALYIAAGSGKRGGSLELDTTESFALPIP